MIAVVSPSRECPFGAGTSLSDVAWSCGSVKQRLGCDKSSTSGWSEERARAGSRLAQQADIGTACRRDVTTLVIRSRSRCLSRVVLCCVCIVSRDRCDCELIAGGSVGELSARQRDSPMSLSSGVVAARHPRRSPPPRLHPFSAAAGHPAPRIRCQHVTTLPMTTTLELNCKRSTVNSCFSNSSRREAKRVAAAIDSSKQQ